MTAIRKTSPTDSRAAKTREQLLHATLGLIRERGYEGACLEALLERAGLTKGAFYFHFASKEDCVLAAIDHSLASEWPAVAEALKTEGPDPFAPVRALFGLFSGSCRTGCIFGNLAGEMAARSPRVREKLAGVFACFLESIELTVDRMKAAGAVGAHLETGALARLILAQLQGAVLLNKLEPDPAVLESHADALVAMLAATAAAPRPLPR